MNVKFIERNLRQFFEVDGQLSSFGLGLNDPTSLALIPNPEATMNSRYWSPGFGSPM